MRKEWGIEWGRIRISWMSESKHLRISSLVVEGVNDSGNLYSDSCALFYVITVTLISEKSYIKFLPNNNT